VTAGLAVTNSSPLIIFYQIDRLDLLRRLLPALAAPPAVAREIAPSLGVIPTWIRVQAPTSIPDPAIALALRLSADVIILDDLAGRRTAKALGLAVIGSAGLLLEARRRERIEAVQPELDAMIDSGLYLSTGLYDEILVAAGERGGRS
jgi:predicted nucleic acid-binding protein